MKNSLLVGLLIIFMILTLSLTGCGSNSEEQQTNEEQNQETVPSEVETVKLNDELEGVYGFAQEINDNQYKVVALKEDGTYFDITNFSSTQYNALDYSSGKIYLLENQKDFYEIDLTKGNGSYEPKNILTYDDNHAISIAAYNGKIYFETTEGNIMVYDMAKGTTEKLIDGGKMSGVYLNKNNGKIYYVEKTPQNFLKEYNIDTGEIKTIDTAENTETYGVKSYYGISIISANSEVVFYSKQEEGEGKTVDDRKTIYYLYSVNTGEKTKVNDELIINGVYSDGKIYYSAATSEEAYASDELRVIENETPKALMEAQEESFIDFCDLGNGKIQTITVEGQDIPTYTPYLIDKETLEVEKIEKTFSLVYLIQDADNKIIDTDEKVVEESEEVNEIE